MFIFEESTCTSFADRCFDFHIIEKRQLIGAGGSRLLREKQQLKIPQEAVFAEEAEALPAESELPEQKSML
ncbi:hypothetical protein [Pseudalkalibacillus caeni]|uniref:Uncharacterized protein n=1 Tax=Exobacillus caeni TaxID=2574798 RepID=A0A5R9F662_9BACL|nr:hypothetical protein [Pseudalkalibacillus caeni]TLS38511.1 hypothetical protein FCL54_05065 [Pseudalkalibacillus caeni]